MFPVLESVKSIERQYRTGEEPVLVMCSDRNAYICKYMRSSSAAYKMVCEFVGVQMAQVWAICTPNAAFVRIKQEHWARHFVQHNQNAPAFGSCQMHGVIDVTPSTYCEVKHSVAILRQLLKIALFDFWIANEDRNTNNANLLYDIENEQLVSIDYGCIFNTATYDFPMSQLTSTDTILWSDLFNHLASENNKGTIDTIVKDLESNYKECIKRSRKNVTQILEHLPLEWNVPIATVAKKMEQLFEKEWIENVWDNFIECLNDNI